MLKLFGISLLLQVPCALSMVSDTSTLNERASIPPLQLNLQNLYNYYWMANISLGTPPQNLSVAVDTGSRDLVITASQTAVCQAGGCLLGDFDYNQSSTFTNIANDFQTQYAQTADVGNWVSDTISIGGVTIDSTFEFGLAFNATIPLNILGVGYPSPQLMKNEPSNTTLQTFVSNSIIPSSSMSIRLADPPALVLGGVDTSAFAGNLAILPIAPEAGQYLRIGAEVTSISLNNNIISSNNLSSLATFDTGAPVVTLPSEVVSSLLQTYNTTSSTIPLVGPIYLIDCDFSTNDTLNFSFSNQTLSMPITNLISPIPTAFLQTLGISVNIPANQCLFTIASQARSGTITDTLLFGSPFIKGYYYMISQDSNEVAFASLSQNSGSNPTIQAIGSGSNALSGISANSNAVVATGTTTASGSAASATGKKNAGARTGGSSGMELMMCAVLAVASLLLL